LAAQKGVKRVVGDREVAGVPLSTLVNVGGGIALGVASIMYAPRLVKEGAGMAGFTMAISELVGKALGNPIPVFGRGYMLETNQRPPEARSVVEFR